jgi:hypothetical protein
MTARTALVGTLAICAMVALGCAPRLQVKSSTGKAAKICDEKLSAYSYKLQREVARNPNNEEAWELLVATYWTLGELPAVYESLDAMSSQFPERHTELTRAEDQYRELEEKYSLSFEKCTDRDVYVERYERAVNWVEATAEATVDETHVFLEISTVPTGAHIIVSDRYLGNSPIRTTVEPGQDVTIQAMLQGHDDIVKVINGRDLKGGVVENVVLKFVKQE